MIYHILPDIRNVVANLPPKWIYNIFPLKMIPIMNRKAKDTIWMKR
jgi:hypothetical protein